MNGGDRGRSHSLSLVQSFDHMIPDRGHTQGIGSLLNSAGIIASGFRFKLYGWHVRETHKALLTLESIYLSTGMRREEECFAHSFLWQRAAQLLMPAQSSGEILNSEESLSFSLLALMTARTIAPLGPLCGGEG
jgi:hypothetical protein